MPSMSLPRTDSGRRVRHAIERLGRKHFNAEANLEIKFPEDYRQNQNDQSYKWQKGGTAITNTLKASRLGFCQSPGFFWMYKPRKRAEENHPEHRDDDELHLKHIQSIQVLGRCECLHQGNSDHQAHPHLDCIIQQLAVDLIDCPMKTLFFLPWIILFILPHDNWIWGGASKQMSGERAPR